MAKENQIVIDRVAKFALAFVASAWIAVAVLLLASAVSGCVYRGAKITEGTDLAIGLTVPGTEGALQFNALNYLSGFRLAVAENAALTVEYSTVATNSYFGVVTTETAKTIKAKVEPCETETPETTSLASPCACPAPEAAAPSASSPAAPAPAGATTAD